MRSRGRNLDLEMVIHKATAQIISITRSVNGERWDALFEMVKLEE